MKEIFTFSFSQYERAHRNCNLNLFRFSRIETPKTLSIRIFFLAVLVLSIFKNIFRWIKMPVVHAEPAAWRNASQLGWTGKQYSRREKDKLPWSPAERILMTVKEKVG